MPAQFKELAQFDRYQKSQVALTYADAKQNWATKLGPSEPRAPASGSGN